MAWWLLLVPAAVLLWPRRPQPLPANGRPSSKSSRPRRGRLWRRRGTSARPSATVLAVLELVAPSLAAGVPPPRAVATSIDLVTGPMDPTPLRDDLCAVAAAARRGEVLGPHWSRLADHYDVTGLEVVGQAWELSESVGCGLRRSLDVAIGLMRAQAERERHLREVTAGPRATMHLLTLLPVAGVGLCALMGVDPLHMYSGRLLPLAVLPGCGLLVAGRLLVRRMIRSAGRPAKLS